MDKKMMINRLKDSVYEFEGLLELLSMRPDKEAELLPLLSARFADMAENFASLGAAPASEPTRDNEPREEYPPVDPVEPEVREAEPEDPEPEIPAVEAVPVEKKPARKAPAFCLNDRFRFRRSVFGGDESLFEAVCTRVADMKDYEEAEEYFYGELGLDPENNDVEDFMTIIREYFAK